MPKSYFPGREAELYEWSTNLYDKLTADPEGYGLTVEQFTEYQPFYQQWHIAYQAAIDPATRTPPAIETKDGKKRAYLAETRKIVRILQASPDMTDAKRRELRLTVRDDEPTPVPPPTMSPAVLIESVAGRSLRLQVRDAQDTGRRARPAGADGAFLYTFVGDTPPTSMAGWLSQGATGRTAVTVTFGDDVPAGSKVWVTAAWFNRRMQTSPLATPQGTYLAGGIATAA